MCFYFLLLENKLFNVFLSNQITIINVFMNSKSFYVTIDFVVERHVKKYLQKKVGDQLIASKHCMFGSFVLDVLTKKSDFLNKIKGDAVVNVALCEKYMKKYGCFFDYKANNKFNLYVDRVFKQELIIYVDLCKSLKVCSEKQAIRKFLEMYDISEDDLKLETAIKCYRRNLNKKQKKK